MTRHSLRATAMVVVKPMEAALLELQWRVFSIRRLKIFGELETGYSRQLQRAVVTCFSAHHCIPVVDGDIHPPSRLMSPSPALTDMISRVAEGVACWIMPMAVHLSLFQTIESSRHP